MDDMKLYYEDVTERYIYQVSKHLDVKARTDIEDELRTLISDMCEERSQEGSISKEDIHAVLYQLGNPRELAEKYRDKTRYLIGPEYFSLYIFILKIVLTAVFIGMTVVTILGLLTEQDLLWYEYVTNYVGNVMIGAGMGFAWVTLLFAVFDWRGINLKDMMQDIHAFDVTELPPVPRNEKRIPLWEPICGLVFSVLLAIIYTLAPHLMGAFYFEDGLKTIPIFNLEVFRALLPLFFITLLLGVSKNIWEIFERSYSRKYAIFVLITNVINIILTIIIFTQSNIWNADFIRQLNSVYQLDIGISLSTVWTQFTNGFVAFLVIIYILDSVSILTKAFKQGR